MKEKILEKYNTFKLRCTNYYKEAFLKLDQKNTFNLAACVFGIYWMIYRRMWFSAIAYVIISAILILSTSAMCTFINYNCYKILFVSFLIAIGFFGNSIYLAEIKWKIKRGYHLSQDFNSTSLTSLILIVLLSDFIKQFCGIVSAFGNNPSVNLKEYFIPIFIYLIVFYYEYHAYKNENTEVNRDDINRYLDKTGNDSPAIWAAIIAACYYLVVYTSII